MKSSELKKEIKDYIYELLSEVDDTATEKAANTAAINAEKLKIKASQEKLANLQKGITESDDEDREPTKAELEKEKVKGANAKKTISDEKFEDFKTKLKNVVKKIKDMKKGKERDDKMVALKQFIKNPELVKAFKERDVQIDTDGLVR
jgi:hypothetical protein